MLMISGFLSSVSNFNYLAGDVSNYINFSFSVSSWEWVRFVQCVCNGPNILKAYILVNFLSVQFLSVLFIHPNGKILIFFKKIFRAITSVIRTHIILKVTYMLDITDK